MRGWISEEKREKRVWEEEVADGGRRVGEGEWHY